MPPKDDRQRSPRIRSVLLATGLLVLGLAPFGVAATGDALREGQRNGTASRETEIVSRTAETGRAKGGYATRQSNLSPSGGGAIYGCRAGTGSNTNPCLRANNLEAGLAFEFNATKGALGGTFTVGNGGDSRKPFTTNATGVATGLNADEVDGQSANEIADAATAKAAADATAKADGAKTRWVLIGPDGAIAAQSGGFKIVDCYRANDDCYIDAGEDVRDNGLSAEIATANNPDAGTDGELTGDTSAAACFFAFVDCGPAGTDSGNGGNAGVFVVTPRNSDGTAAAAGDRYPFYAFVTG
jgi:hypothetical protein